MRRHDLESGFSADVPGLFLGIMGKIKMAGTSTSTANTPQAI
jgi:hypothetical protein